jgi:hypothetical protein
MVVLLPSKQGVGVRFPLPALKKKILLFIFISIYDRITLAYEMEDSEDL